MTATVLRFSNYEKRPTVPRAADQEDSIIILPMVRVERAIDDLKKLHPKR